MTLFPEMVSDLIILHKLKLLSSKMASTISIKFNKVTAFERTTSYVVTCISLKSKKIRGPART